MEQVPPPVYGLTAAFTAPWVATLQGTLTANRAYTFPNTSGTVALIDYAQTWTATQSFAAVSCTALTASTGFQYGVIAVGTNWNEQFIITTTTTVEPKIVLAGSGGYRWSMRQEDPTGVGALSFRYEEGGLDVLQLERSGAATFAGSVKAGQYSDTVHTTNGDFRGFRIFGQSDGLTEAASDQFNFTSGEYRHTAGYAGYGGHHTFYAMGALALTIASTGAATFASSVSCTALTATDLIKSTVADGVVGFRTYGASGQLAIYPYINGTNGVTLNSMDVAGALWQPMSFQASSYSFLQASTATFASSVSCTALTASGQIKGNFLTFTGNSLEEYSVNGVSDVAVNYTGYNGGTTQFRNLTVYDGKQAQVFQIVGSTKAATFASSVSCTALTQGSADFHNFGDPTVDGTWRFGRSGNNFVIERRESSTWVTKQTISA